MSPAADPVLAMVRLKEGRSYHAHGQIWRSDRPVEVRDPALLARALGDGLLAVSKTEAGRSVHVAPANIEHVASAETTDHVAEALAEQVAPGATEHVADEHVAEQVEDLPAVHVDAVPPAQQDDVAGVVSEQDVLPQISIILEACRVPLTRLTIQKLLGIKHRMRFQRTYLFPLLQSGLLARTVPDKVRSRMQRYVTTPAGLLVLAAKGGDA